MELNIHNLIDDAKCFEAVRNLRWPSEVKCPHCQSNHIVKRGKDDVHEHRNIMNVRAVTNVSMTLQALCLLGIINL